VARDELAARIRRAEAYPFDVPGDSYLFPEGRLEGVDIRGRVPVIACGSNASPARLREKLGEGARVPVLRARLAGHAVVYAAHFAAYGALPATLHPCPGATAHLFVTLLAPGLLERMHATEGTGDRYDYRVLDGLDLAVEGLGRIERAGAYLATAGTVLRDGAPVRLAAVRAEGCPWPARGQAEMLRWAHARLAPERSWEAFMDRVTGSRLARLRYRRRLEGLPFEAVRTTSRAP
jgi:hypothetical protein